ncbi:MAG: rhodanese-like domain-containing protein [Acidobacteria bacterium]|nr:rhodanese-like domain-containing protein [Acidobacteriota bacterium]
MFDRISPHEVKELLESGEGYVYLDVRAEDEFAAGHVPGARNVPIMVRDSMGMSPNPEFLAVVEANFPKDSKIITGCLRGGRSTKAARILLSAGYVHVKDMRGGLDGEMGPGGVLSYEGWARLDLPVALEPDAGATYEELRSRR